MSNTGLLSILKEDLASHGNDWTRPGFRALAYYRFGNWRMQVKPKVLRAPFSIIYRFLFRRARNLYGIELPYSAKIGRRVVFEHQHGIVVHGNAEIGDGTIVRQGVTIGNRSLDDVFAAPTIGKNVNIGAGAKILGAVKIGNNVSIGANAVVLHDVAEGAAVVGIPAKPLTAKSTNQIEET